MSDLTAVLWKIGHETLDAMRAEAERRVMLALAADLLAGTEDAAPALRAAACHAAATLARRYASAP